MANTYVLISSQTLASTTASITFSSIPQTYTDLKFVTSCRSDGVTTATGGVVNFNSSAVSFVSTAMYGTGSGIGYLAGTTEFGSMPAANFTASAFSNSEVYIPNYTSAKYKSYCVDTATENNATQAYCYLFTGRWDNTAAITSIKYTPATGSFISGSTFYLYGISSS